jgi:molybdopterin converting factor small subunit
MAIVQLRSPLRELAGGAAEVEVTGTTVEEVVHSLADAHPRLRGWVLDENGALRRHVSLFLNDRSTGLHDPVSPQDRIFILGAISGGASDVELLVGTRKGLFVLRGARGGGMDVAVRQFAGQTCEYAIKDRRTGTYYAAMTHGQFGPHLYYTDDPSGDWEEASGIAFPEGGGESVERIWTIQPAERDGVLWAGVAPAALFRSEDSGRSWTLVRSLWEEPSRPLWGIGAGGQCLHSIATWPGDPARLALGISAAGVWLTEDEGETWHRGVQGLVPRYLPDPPPPEIYELCVHNIHRSRIQPETIYMQFHGGVYRSDDAGESWSDIGTDTGLPSDFGFPLVADPNDPDRALIVPLQGDFDRVTPDGAVRVYETRDRGASWKPLTNGLPQEEAFLTILRQAFAHDGGDPLGLYFGAESGDLFGSIDDGSTWSVIADHLPPVVSVRVA